MKNEPWDKHVMDSIVAVNRNLHKGGMLPEKAQRMLYGLEDTVFRVAQEIRANGELFNQRKEERRIERERWKRERAAKRLR